MKIKKTIAVFAAVSTILTVVLYTGFSLILAPNVKPVSGRAIVYIPDGASFDQALDSVKAALLIKNSGIFRWLAVRKNYPHSVKSGRYVFEKPVSYNTLINILRGGRQTPLEITFSKLRTLNELAGRIGGQIEADSAEIIDFFSDQDNFADDGFTKENVIAVFIPNTYELYWNTTARKLYSRMLREYRKFWNDDRIKKSQTIGLTPVEVSVLASIVDEEASRGDEKPRIAGVYLNRLKRGIPLQADPTVKFAVNDFTLNRILYKHLETESPYNTYKHSGLPPGPISCATVEGIDAVLNAEKHDFLYFAAKPDFSGYHNFSRTLAEHNRYASQYRRELNRRKIYR
ncbi:MAG TPA: endolytic transglycosylase MltG [Bacteroidales bacterium]|jgi:UPF0755 protein|nr:endolytic transglycosylase MltG [Bacteroidales bacterium]